MGAQACIGANAPCQPPRHLPVLPRPPHAAVICVATLQTTIATLGVAAPRPHQKQLVDASGDDCGGCPFRTPCNAKPQVGVRGNRRQHAEMAVGGAALTCRMPPPLAQAPRRRRMFASPQQTEHFRVLHADTMSQLKNQGYLLWPRLKWRKNLEGCWEELGADPGMTGRESFAGKETQRQMPVPQCDGMHTAKNLVVENRGKDEAGKI